MNDNSYKVVEVDINEILPNRFQPRIQFDEEEILELSDSIKEHGVIQPIIVRTIGDKYEIIAGERRYKASVLAGKETVPVIIKKLNDKDSAEIALIENIQRKNLTPIEEALSYKKILDMGYLTQESLAMKLGKSQSSVANKVRLLNLSDEVQEALLDNKISERHARSLLRIKTSSEQNYILERIIKERLTVRKTDEEIDKLLNGDIKSIEKEEKGEIEMNNGINQIPNIVTQPGNTFDIFGGTEQNSVNSISAVPSMEMPSTPVAPSMEMPTMEMPSAPVAPSMEMPTMGIPSAPVVPSMEVPTMEIPSTPVAPSMEMPTMGIPSAPVVPSMEVPTMEIPSTPVAPSMEVPTMEIPSTPVAPIMEMPTMGIPSTPVAPSMEVPTMEIPSTPVTTSMEMPTMEIPSAPVVPSMEVPTMEIPSAPVAPSMEVPIMEMPSTPIAPSMEVPQTHPIELSTNISATPETVIQTPMIEKNEFNSEGLNQLNFEAPSNIAEPISGPIIITDYNKQYDPIMPNQPQIAPTKVDFKEIVNAIRECSLKIEKFGYKIDVEEYDLSTLYQVVFKIEK